MKYLNSAPFSSQPATDAYRENYPFRDKFEEALAAEKMSEEPASVIMGELHCLRMVGSEHEAACIVVGGKSFPCCSRCRELSPTVEHICGVRR